MQLLIRQQYAHTIHYYSKVTARYASNVREPSGALVAQNFIWIIKAGGYTPRHLAQYHIALVVVVNTGWEVNCR